MSLKILVTDTHCALGQALEHDFEREHCQLFTPSSGKLNWEDAIAVSEYILHIKPDVVVNTCGWEDIPSAEQQRLLPIAATNVALATSQLGVPLVQMSSYKVFGNDNKSSHSEKDIPSPVSLAGQAFFSAEQAVEHSHPRAIILRLGWVIGSYGENHLSRLLRDIQSQEPVTLNSRLRGAPTLLSDAARVTVALVKQIACGAENWGVMHYCSGDAVNESEFAEQVVQLLAQQHLLSMDVNFTQVDTAPEDEPVSAVLGCRRIRDTFGVQARPWRPSLLPLVKQWFHNQQTLLVAH